MSATILKMRDFRVILAGSPASLPGTGRNKPGDWEQFAQPVERVMFDLRRRHCP